MLDRLKLHIKRSSILCACLCLPDCDQLAEFSCGSPVPVLHTLLPWVWLYCSSTTPPPAARARSSILYNYSSRWEGRDVLPAFCQMGVKFPLCHHFLRRFEWRGGVPHPF